MSAKGNYTSLEASLIDAGLLDGVLKLKTRSGPFLLKDIGIKGHKAAQNLQKKELIAKVGRTRIKGIGTVNLWTTTTRLVSFLNWLDRRR